MGIAAALVFFAITNPSVTAGLIWHPEIGPIAYAITNTDRPKANETPNVPTLNAPLLAELVASTAVPQPPNTSTIVPMSSAIKILTLSSFTSSPFSSSTAREVNTISARTRKDGYLWKSLNISALIIAICLLLTSCKATGTLNVTLGDNASGKMEFVLALDEEATSIIRRDNFDVEKLSSIFNTKKLQEANFKVEIENDSQIGASQMKISTRFTSEKELQAALSVLAPPEVLYTKIDSSKTLLKEKQDASITVDLKNLRKMYLEDESVKTAVQQAGIDYPEFEALINDAFSSSTLNVRLKANGDEDSFRMPVDKQEKKTATISAESLRLKFIINTLVSIGCLIAAIYLFWRLRHRPRVLFTSTQNKG